MCFVFLRGCDALGLEEVRNGVLIFSPINPPRLCRVYKQLLSHLLCFEGLPTKIRVEIILDLWLAVVLLLIMCGHLHLYLFTTYLIHKLLSFVCIYAQIKQLRDMQVSGRGVFQCYFLCYYFELTSCILLLVIFWVSTSFSVLFWRFLSLMSCPTLHFLPLFCLLNSLQLCSKS